MTTTRRALLVIDVQEEYFHGPLTIQYPTPTSALAKIGQTLEAAEAADLPVALIVHENPAGSAAFAAGSEGQRLHPAVDPGGKYPVFTKNRASSFTAPGLLDWLRSKNIDTLALVGFMTNNCLLGTAAAAEPLGLAVEVLRDASGAINLANEAGSVPAQQVHDTLMVLLHSNWAATATTETWAAAVAAGKPLAKSNLVYSATGMTAGQ